MVSLFINEDGSRFISLHARKIAQIAASSLDLACELREHPLWILEVTSAL